MAAARTRMARTSGEGILAGFAAKRRRGGGLRNGWPAGRNGRSDRKFRHCDRISRHGVRNAPHVMRFHYLLHSSFLQLRPQDDEARPVGRRLRGAALRLPKAVHQLRHHELEAHILAHTLRDG